MRVIHAILVVTAGSWCGMTAIGAGIKDDGNRLLAKAKEAREEAEPKTDKTERRRAKEKEGEATKKEAPAKPERAKEQAKEQAKTVVGVLAVAASAEGIQEATVTTAAGKVYVLGFSADDLPKAQTLAGQRVAVKGRVRNRNGRFLVDRIQSCRPVGAEAETKHEAPEGAPRGEE